MKGVARILISMIILAFSTQLFALKSRECPPIDIISANSKFIKAFDLGDDAWMLRSASFKLNADSWAIVFLVKLPNDVTAEEALRLGQTYFAQNVTLSEPVKDEDDQITECEYADTSDYHVSAVAPAVVVPHLAKFSGKPWHI